MMLDDRMLDLARAQKILVNPPVALDLVTSICGDWLGTGVYREVFDYNLDDRFVVKIEPENTGCNMAEYMIWQEVKGLVNNLEWVKKWFAPVEWISPNGRILVMRKTKECYKRKRPNKIPAFIWDAHQDNFGWIGNNFVCHDYGQIYNLVKYSKKMVKAEWS